MNAIILLATTAEVLLLIICIIGYRVAFLKRQLTDLRIKMVISYRCAVRVCCSYASFFSCAATQQIYH